jgi:YggT family protein
MALIGDLLMLALNIYMWVILIGVAVSWLIAFEVINTRNPQAANLVTLLNKLTEPVYKPVRKFIPPIGGIDLTPIVIIIGIYVLQTIVNRIFY